ncbi:hypothetical protein JHK85_051660 [Glycine max]|nr:hypothetical protein JHK85_051660 [Glycine max]
MMIKKLEANRVYNKQIEAVTLAMELTAWLIVPVREIGSTTKQKLPRILTLWYRAPEVLLGATHYSTVNKWSVGYIFGKNMRIQGSSEVRLSIISAQKI